ncbi:MAG: SDR family NAD(P)-dependent oxidoreductase [Proteobacteria bacterium]|nr:SDR family NAD(P)-dependent oxidoreductase [Pseudomonadota bacterium]
MSAADWIDLTGKVVHVTGGAKGIGVAIATALASAVATVADSDIDANGAARTAADIGGIGMALDVGERVAVEAALNDTVSQLGSLDIIVNNAGVYTSFGGPVRDITDEIWRTLWSVNVDGVFYCCRAAANIIIKAGNGGRIINVSSTQAVTPGVGVTYDGSKAAVAQMTKALALELAPHRINVNALAPGPTWVGDGDAPSLDAATAIQTGNPLGDTIASRISRLPAGHWGSPMEQGKAAVFLASSMSDFVTRIYLPVDGGWLTL